MDSADQELLLDIARREFTTRQLMDMYELSKEELEAFVQDNYDMLTNLRNQLNDPNSELSEEVEVSQLWISSKVERLKRYQQIAERLINSQVDDATTLREIRSYLRYAAEELGQLLHRGSGEGASDSTVHYSIEGVDMEKLT